MTQKGVFLFFARLSDIGHFKTKKIDASIKRSRNNKKKEKMATKVGKYDIKQLLRFVESKHVAVPEFQRGYVWRTRQVKDLFDSLIKQYPIGSFILWKTRQHLDARTLDGEKLPKEKYLILDGQQRMTSLYYLNKPGKFLQVKDKFHEICETREKQLIDFEKFLIASNGKKGPELDYQRESNSKFDAKRFRRMIGASYRFPVVIISLDTYRQAIQVFERINQAGTRISTESIFLSETWSSHTNISKLLRTWKNKNPDGLTAKIDTIIFIHVFALIHQLENKRQNSQIAVNIKILKTVAEDVRAESRERYNNRFNSVIQSVADANNYLKEEFGIKSVSELPSQTMLTVLSVFFYYQRRAPGNNQRKELRKWFWRSSLASRYIGSGYHDNIGPDAIRMRDLALKKRRLNVPAYKGFGYAKFRDVDLRTGRSTLRNVVKQVLWKQSPMFINGTLVNREDVEAGNHKPENDHFFPFDWSRKGFIGDEINNILNLHFLNKDENVRKSKKLPSEWLTERIRETGAKATDIEKYFKSELLPFKNIKDLKRYEKAFKLKGKGLKLRGRGGQKEFARRYERFRWKRFKLFELALIRLQNGATS